jgi:undecaprenyl diphosphate synthase
MRPVPATTADMPSPRHVGLIMDGNGRWAQERGLPRIEGHRRGVEALRRAIRAASDLNIRYLSVYAFSTENWRRPRDEVSFLMGLLKRYIRSDLAELNANGVCIRVIGQREGLTDDVAALLDEAVETTRGNTRLNLIIAFNYGARQEMTEAMRRIGEKIAAGLLAPNDITPGLIGDHLDTAAIPDPDLIIRTSGEQRLSNFLLWQAAYAEFVFLDLRWPDFDRAAFDRALAEYGARQRRFGDVSPMPSEAPLSAKTGS